MFQKQKYFHLNISKFLKVLSMEPGAVGERGAVAPRAVEQEQRPGLESVMTRHQLEGERSVRGKGRNKETALSVSHTLPKNDI